MQAERFVELYSDDSRLTRGLKSAQDKLRSFGQSVQQIGTQMFKVGLGITVPFALGAKQFASFESAMARVKALTGATGSDFAMLTDRARELGRDTVFTATEAAQAMSFFALAGFKVDQIMKATGPTLDMAAAGQLGIAEAADIAAKIMAGSGIAATDLGAAVDVLTKAMTTANTDLRQLGDAFKFIGPIAKSAGMSFEETTAAVQILSNAGIQAEMAGTTLRGGILSLTSPSKEGAAVMEQLGVKIADAKGNMRSLADIVEQLEAGLKGMGNAQQLKLLGDLFSQRQAGGFSEIISKGAPKLREMTKELGNAGGTAKRIADIQLDTLTGSWKILTSAVEDLLISVGGAVAPTLREWGRAMQVVSNAVSVFVANNSALAISIGKWAVGIMAAGAALIALGIAAKVAAFSIGIVIAATKLYFSTPVLILRAFATVAGLWMAFTTEGKHAASEWVATWGRIKTTAVDAWGGIVDAVMAGDLSLAGHVAFNAFQLVWLETVAALKTTWQDFLDWFRTSGWETSLRNLMDLFKQLTGGWKAQLADIRDAWEAMTFQPRTKRGEDEKRGALPSLFSFVPAFADLFSGVFGAPGNAGQPGFPGRRGRDRMPNVGGVGAAAIAAAGRPADPSTAARFFGGFGGRLAAPTVAEGLEAQRLQAIKAGNEPLRRQIEELQKVQKELLTWIRSRRENSATREQLLGAAGGPFAKLLAAGALSGVPGQPKLAGGGGPGGGSSTELGTFNPFAAVAALGGGSPAQQAVKLAQKAEKQRDKQIEELIDIGNRLDNVGVEFA